MINTLSRPAIALALTCPLLLAPPALAFDATGNDVADRFLEIVEAGNATVSGYDGVSQSGASVTISGLRTAIEEGSAKSRLTIRETTIDDGQLTDDGGLSAATLTMGGVNIEDLDEDEDVTVTAESIVISDPVLASPAEVKASNGADAIAPTYSRAELTNIVIDAADEGRVPVSRIVAVIDEMDGSLPTSGSLSVEGIEIAADSLDDDEREVLSDLGYESLTLSFQMDADWKPDTGKLAIDRLTLSGENAGTVNAALRISGLTREVLEQLDAAQDNPEQAMGLMQGLLVESVTLRIDNDSLVDRVLENQAKEAGSTREAFVEQLTGALPFMLSMLNNAEFQAKVAGAATAFLQDPQSLSATATPAAPVPFAQILGTAMMAPQSLPDILGVTITANED
ncbi:hypothetical protein [Stappia stellulata]|uniref:hypothetical protein n=1 Tax=Stappia stellulata TaxID=71235 RepID=UPI00041F62B8|nr:hypothetical protein [Stappia stellulata]